MKKMLKKVIVSTLIAISITGTTYAASFTDVPQDHWAYASIKQLGKDGLIEGYGDGTFKGDKPINRFEMAILVGKAIDRFDQADEADKQEIDRLSAEFAGELNRMGVRVAKLEAKTNVWAGGETRFRYVSDSPQASGDKKLRGSDNFQFRQRVKFWGTINEDYSWFARLTASGQAGNYNNGGDGTTAGFDVFAITAKKQLGLDSIRLGRYPLDSFGSGLMGKAIGVDGVRIDKKIGAVDFIGAVNNVKSLGASDQGSGTDASGDARTLTTGQVGFKVNDNLSWRAGYYMADVPGTAVANGTGTMNVGGPIGSTVGSSVAGFNKSHGWATGFASKIGNYQLFGDYISSQLVDATAGLPRNPKAWAVEFTNSTVTPPVFFSAVNLVNPGKAGTDAWMISYRSVDAGALPDGAGGFDTMAVAYGPKPYSIMKGTDNVNVIYFAYQNVVTKNVVASFEYQNFQIKNQSLTNLTSKNLDQTYMMKLEFFY